MELNNIQPNITAVVEQTSTSAGATSNINEIEKKVNQHVSLQNIDLNKVDSVDKLDKAEADPGNMDAVRQAVSQLNKIVQSLDKKLRFFIDEESGKFGVKIIDKESNEIIRQIPPEEALALSAKIQETVGMLLDEKT